MKKTFKVSQRLFSKIKPHKISVQFKTFLMSNEHLSRVTIEESRELILFIRKKINEHGNLFKVNKISDKKEKLIIISPNKESKFYFAVYHGKVEMIQGTPYNFFPLNYSPRNHYDNSNLQTKDRLTQTKIKFQIWVENMLAQQIDLYAANPYLKQYEEEYYSDYKLIDEGADVEAFSISIQRDLYLYFDCLAESLENSGDDSAELIEEIKVLQSNIPSFSKNGVVMGMAKIAAKCHAKGIAFTDKYWSGIKEETFKELVKGGVKEIKENAVPFAIALKEIFIG